MPWLKRREQLVGAIFFIDLLHSDFFSLFFIFHLCSSSCTNLRCINLRSLLYYLNSFHLQLIDNKLELEYQTPFILIVDPGFRRIEIFTDFIDDEQTNALFGNEASLPFTLHLFYSIFHGINVFGALPVG